ncbi:hypothetical protein PInf_008981 [Phytophthora infestans]|nr:hypothetical protein PInf_008981 [Phytophthora infestans]
MPIALLTQAKCSESPRNRLSRVAASVGRSKMLSAPLMLFRSGDASLTSDLRVLVARSKAPKGDWLGQFFTGMGTHLAALREAKSRSDSSSDSSADESDQEKDDGVMIDTDDEKDKAHNLIDPTDEDLSDSDGSSDLENSYPQLPSAPVDTLIAFRQRAAQKELQMSEKLKKEVIADARQRHQERQQALRSKKKKKSPQSKRRHSKQSDSIFNGSNHTNGSTGTADAMEDEWMVDCSCGLKEKNYDDGTSMIQCDSCSHWVHAKCADKQPEAVAQEKFLCFRCGWMFDCVCDIRRQLNHDDGQRMVECESCETWQHTKCVGIPMTEEPADDYRCPRCVKKARRRKSGSKAVEVVIDSESEATESSLEIIGKTAICLRLLR